MTKQGEKLSRKNWVSKFKLVGKAKVNDYTFKLDEQSKNSSWVYNSMNLGIDCGDKYGVCYCSMMGGYSPDRETTIYANMKDDFTKTAKIAWEDRNDPDILDELHFSNFTSVALEVDSNGKNYKREFLSPYDAIKAIHKLLKDGMTVCVVGNLQYREYNGTVQMDKVATGIFLSTKEPEEFEATFTQSVLLGEDSVSPADFDKMTGILPVDGIVLDYVKEVNGHEVKTNFPYHFNFECQFDPKKPEILKVFYKNLLKVKKGYTQVNFVGDFVSSGNTVAPTLDDVDDEIRGLIGVCYTEEEVLRMCAGSGSREQHVFLRSPNIENITDDDGVVHHNMQRYEERYTEEELDFSWAMANDEEPPFDETVEVHSGDDDDFDSFLNDL